MSRPAQESPTAPSRPPATALPRSWPGPAILGGIGLVLAIAGTFPSTEASSPITLASRIDIALPDWLLAAAVGSLSVASLIFLAMILPRRRRRKKDDDDFELYHEPQRIPALVAVGLILLALVPGALLGGAMLWLGHEDIALTPRAGTAVKPAAPPAPGAPAPQFDLPQRPASPLTTGLVGTLALLIGFGTLGLVLWLRYGDRWMRRLPADFRELGARLGAAVDDSLDDLRLEQDVRAAIVKSYGHFEKALARASMPRRPWETPFEFMQAVLRRLPLPATPVGTLTRLFEVARFSDHPIAPAERDSAWRSLVEIRDALDKEKEKRERRDAETS